MRNNPRAGERNLISDVGRVLVGNAGDDDAMTGVTVLRCEKPMTAAVDVRGGGPGSRETDVLAPENLVDKIEALVLSGGSVFGLAAADAVATTLSHQNVGLQLTKNGPAIPIVPAAVLHDLSNGGTKDWGETPPYQALGRSALAAAGPQFELGMHGAGKGARCGSFPGGLGSASVNLGADMIVGALAVVNSVGSALLPDGETFYAWQYEHDGEFGNQKPPPKFDLLDPFPKFGRLGIDHGLKPGTSTTLAAIATSLDLTGAELKRVAMMAHDGMARAIRPAHTPFDGDIVFALSAASTRLPPKSSSTNRAIAVARIGSAAADCLARAIARGVYEARTSKSEG